MDWLRQLRQHLLTGVSFAIPFVACGGILIAAALAFAPKGANNAPDPSGVPVLQFMLTIGVASFGLMLPILAGYIAYSIAGKPGLVPGMIGGFLSGRVAELPKIIDMTTVEGVAVKIRQMQAVSAGFLGALVAGLIAGYLVQGIKRIPTHKLVKPIMPILIIPIVSSVVIGVLMLVVIGPPIAQALLGLNNWLLEMRTGNAVFLAMILGAMIAFDMGGPVNKAAFFFASGLIAMGNTKMMGPVAAAICTPPLGLGLATIISRKQWREEERECGYAALGMGMIGITEGAIPFAAADPLRVIPCIMLGSMVASTVAMLAGVGDHAPHGGPIVLPVVDNRLMYVIAILAGSLVTALAINTLKKAWKAPGERTPAAP
jgi:PTS system fructose-specific IIC component